MIGHRDSEQMRTARECEDEDDEPAIEMQPGSYMAFFNPWDGDYDI